MILKNVGCFLRLFRNWITCTPNNEVILSLLNESPGPFVFSTQIHREAGCGCLITSVEATHGNRYLELHYGHSPCGEFQYLLTIHPPNKPRLEYLVVPARSHVEQRLNGKEVVLHQNNSLHPRVHDYCDSIRNKVSQPTTANTL
jgi:hypothetical protein